MSAGAPAMTDVTLTFNGRGYRLACAPGEEARLEALAAELSRRLDVLIETHGQVGDERLLLMAALQYADEADDLRRALEAAEQRRPAKSETRSRKSAPPPDAPPTPSGEDGERGV